jgi:hypothetical protein
MKDNSLLVRASGQPAHLRLELGTRHRLHCDDFAGAPFDLGH